MNVLRGENRFGFRGQLTLDFPTIIAYSFLRNGYNYCLANVFRKMEIAYKNGTAFREIPMKEEYGLSMLLASGLLQGCAAKHESGR